MKQILAIPSNAPGGLTAEVSEHFGHCAAFTVVSIDNGTIGDVWVLHAPDHASGGCLTPVDMLARAGVTAIAADGMGRRPLLAFLDAGIPLYLATGFRSVGDVVTAFGQRRLATFATDGCCGRHDHDHEDEHGDGGCGQH